MAQFIISAFADEASTSLQGQIDALKRNGLGYIEPRNIEGGLKKGIIDKTDDELFEIAEAFRKNNISISALGSPIGKVDIDKDFDEYLPKFRRALRACEILGAKRMRMFSFFVSQDRISECRDEVLRRLQILLDEAERAGVLLCHENESEIYGQNPEQVADLLTSLPQLKGVFDAANYVMNDQDSIAGFEATLPSLEYLHIKDARSAEKCIVPCGTGDGQYPEILRRVGDGTDRTVILTVEPHLHVFDAYAKIDKHPLKTGIEFASSDEAFDYAVNSLKKVLTDLGYHEEGNKIWKK